MSSRTTEIAAEIVAVLAPFVVEQKREITYGELSGAIENKFADNVPRMARHGRTSGRGPGVVLGARPAEPSCDGGLPLPAGVVAGHVSLECGGAVLARAPSCALHLRLRSASRHSPCS